MDGEKGGRDRRKVALSSKRWSKNSQTVSEEPTKCQGEHVYIQFAFKSHPLQQKSVVLELRVHDLHLQSGLLKMNDLLGALVLSELVTFCVVVPQSLP